MDHFSEQLESKVTDIIQLGSAELVSEADLHIFLEIKKIERKNF
jgi:hypothetical protein